VKAWRGAAARHLAAMVLALVGAACRSRSQPAPQTDATEAGAAMALGDSATPSASVARLIPIEVIDSGPPASGIPLPAASVEAAINPAHAPPYSGPTGAIEGEVHVSGDQAPKRTLQIPFECGEAYATYGKAFREGNGRTLADVMVAVTQYDGFVPAASDVYPVTIHGCAFDKRTLALAFGQRIEVRNADAAQFFLPVLVGADLPAQNIAVPRGDPVRLYPLQVGHYVLADGMQRTWMYADVLVVRYATHSVTGLDGHYRVTGIPVGKAKVSAYLPAIDVGLHPDVGMQDPSVEREVLVKAGETSKLDFVIPYKAPKPAPKSLSRPEGAVIR
jgi:hypothetical protein